MKQAFFYIDDFIWSFRDVARQKPASLFDNAYFGMLKRIHDKYGMTVQLNIFYRTDFFYGEDEFTLSEFPDTYKAEWEANADWLKLGFHSKQEFPLYPYINAGYEEMKISYERIAKEILRFAGEKTLADAVVPHWLPISREGCKALHDCGVRYVSCSVGDDVQDYVEGDARYRREQVRILHKRKPETKVYTRLRQNLPPYNSLCAYNHLSEAQAEQVRFKNASIYDAETGIRFRLLSGGPCLNLYSSPKEIEEILDGYKDVEYIGCANHEQYFYPDYYNYQPGMEEMITAMARTLHKNGFTFITCEDLK